MFFFSGILQDVAYGTKVEFHSGEEQHIGNAVITSKFSHTIAFYKQYSDSKKYLPLSDSSLWRIFMKPITAEVLGRAWWCHSSSYDRFWGFWNASDFFKRTDLKDALEKSKRYLKTQYRLNCNDTIPISSHNIAFVLSDPCDESFRMVCQVDPGKVCNKYFNNC